MDNIQWFILIILGLIVLNNMHRRGTRRRLILALKEEDCSAQDIEKIMKAFKED